MKNYVLLTLPILCAAIGPVSADAMGKQQSSKAPMNTTQPMNQITPAANPKPTHWADPYFTADFIWWKAQEDGLTYAYTGSVVTSTETGKGKAYQPKFKYEPGFKVGFGLKFEHDGWDFYGNYTWFRTYFSGSKNTVYTPSDSLLTTNIYTAGGNSGTYNGSASASWQLHFNALDVELGRNYWISQWLTLRPHFGMKFSWIDQDLHLDYLNAVSPSGANSYSRFDQDQNAVGLRTGLDTAWYMWKKWCIFGEFAVSGLWNDFDVHRKDTLTLTDGNSYTVMNLKRDSRSVTAVVEIALGLRFETAFHNDDYLFMLQAGWEEQIWFNQNQFFKPLVDSTENLTFEGLTVKAGFSF